jgi:hypothetical protein
LKWAKAVADDFLEAAHKGNLDQAESPIDSSLKKSFANQGPTALREWLNNSLAIRGLRAAVFEAGRIAPDQDAASFKGMFRGQEQVLRFSLRVVKDSQEGKWRVSDFHFTEPDQ